MARQIEELINELSPESIDVLDVGGDILARGDEPTLKSPLGDALTLAACAQVNADVRLLIAGPGLDGEIPAEDLRGRLGPRIHTLTTEHIEPISSVLEWHPSEATAMLAATAHGVRGRCEIRDAGLPVPLTDEGPTVHEADLDEALQRNELARQLLTTTSLDQAEAHSREICGYSEIDHERIKALRLTDQAPKALDPDTVMPQLAEFEARARLRGITHTTFRRLTETLGFNGTQREDLRTLLIHTHPEQYTAPLWHIPVE
jgi:hypothetical protein